MSGVTPSLRLVLVHGTQLSAAQWHGYAARLGPAVEVVTPDLPAHGTRRDEEFTWEGALAVIDEAVRSAPPRRPVVLGGHSLGGYLAMAWAARHPDALAGLVPMGSCAIPRGPGAAAYRLWGRLAQRLGPERMTTVMDRQFDRFVPDAEHVLAMRQAGYTVAGMGPSWQGVMTEIRPELLGDVSCPIWFVNGQFDQLRINAKAFAGAARRSPRVTVVMIPRAPHIFPMTHPTETTNVLARALSAGHP